ncbi:hypothetical protein ACJMK2_009498 [Sinanodonta woodiana]|uniref:Metallo-beta-lactamase domain-containing protein n=1 Tax=Sinanodonta woodiana TaxID=1069815 RepID=A0ABD3VCI5_SINWO
MNVSGTLVVLVLSGLTLSYLGQQIYTRFQQSHTKRLLEEFDAFTELKEHTKEFNVPEVIKVTQNVYVAVGFGLANSILIEGPNGAVVVDVMESYEAGIEVMRAFRNITKSPIKALIYTHNHADHTYGAKAFIEDPENPPQIWAHYDIEKEFRRTALTSASGFRRAMRQFGVLLPERLNSGIGIRLRYGKTDKTLSIVHPTHFVHNKETDVDIAGMRMRLIHIPGETDDQIGVWLPNDKTLLCADDIYKAFPNLYAIRGTPSRDLIQWVSTLDLMLDLNPDYLVPSHTRPLSGASYIQETLTVYRDAIQYVHDQTVRLINAGIAPDDIAQSIRLPENLATHPYLKEFYGTVGWSAKAVFSNYIGWFSGDPVDLQPLTFKERSIRLLNILGGPERVVQESRAALERKDFQWALELSSYVLSQDKDNPDAKKVKVEALTSLASRHSSANGRNYYLTCAYEEVTGINIHITKEMRGMAISSSPLHILFSVFSVRFKADQCSNKNETLVFRFTDTEKVFSVQIRNSVAIVRESDVRNGADIEVTLTETIWKQILTGGASTIMSLANGSISVKGGILKFSSFMNCFDRD